MEHFEIDDRAVESNGSQNDDGDMQRMALHPELDRRFNLGTNFGFACILGATWEYALVTSLAALTNGGTGGLIWLFLGTMFGMFMVVLSLAEMASIAPTSGGQYHWASEFAPLRVQRLYSYGVGWFTAIGWQASVAGNALIIAQQIQALAAFQDPDYVVKGWVTTLLMIAATILATAINMYGVRLLPWLETAMFTLHVAGFFVILFPLWFIGERSSSQDVFFTFQDNAGWGSIGTACLVGLLGPTVTLVGGDSACHLAEETKNASKALPLAMTFTAVVNYILGFIMTITVLFVSGNFSEDIADATGEPYVAVMYAATGSRTATIVFTILLIFLFFCCTINCITTTSRQLFAFARDGGVPYSQALGKVDARTGLPFNSLLATFLVTLLLSWIPCLSTIAFQNIISISLVGLLLSYFTTIAIMMYRRRSAIPLPNAYLRYPPVLGYIINGLALCFLGIAFVFIFFPTEPHPSLEAMNWSVVVTAAVIIVAGVYYLIKGKETFEGPVVRMNRAGQGSQERESVGVNKIRPHVKIR